MDPALRSTVGGRSRWSKWPLAALFVAGLSLTTAAPAHAAGDTLDQSQTFIYSYGYQQLSVMAQTFTAGMTGQLDRVSLASDTPYGFTSLNVAIETVATDGTPSGTVLGWTTFQGSLGCCQQFHDFSFNPGVSITAGTHYAIVVTVYVGIFRWYDSGWMDVYPGGQLYVSCLGCGSWYTGSSYGQDFAFKTWVATSTNQTPQQAINAISAHVQEISSLNAGQKNSLTAKLDAASAALSRGDTTAANNQLNAFLNELEAYLSAGKVSSADAADLRSAIHAVQAALGVYNRFLSWWSAEA